MRTLRCRELVVPLRGDFLRTKLQRALVRLGGRAKRGGGIVRLGIARLLEIREAEVVERAVAQLFGSGGGYGTLERGHRVVELTSLQQRGAEIVFEPRRIGVLLDLALVRSGSLGIVAGLEELVGGVAGFGSQYGGDEEQAERERGGGCGGARAPATTAPAGEHGVEQHEQQRRNEEELKARAMRALALARSRLAAKRGECGANAHGLVGRARVDEHAVRGRDGGLQHLR